MTDPDVLVVGAGSAGCALAAGLVRRGLRVTLVEAGPDYGPFDGGGWPADLLDARVMPRSHGWGYLEARQGEEREERRARVVGGCSSHNQCAAVWPQPGDLDAWRVPGWGDADLAPALESVRVQLAPAPHGRLSLWQRTLLETALAAGLPAAPFSANVRDGVRWNAAFAFLDPVRDDALLELRSGLSVDRVLLDGRRAQALLCRDGDEELELGADRVVLCAGAYGSAEILVRSGIGPAEDVEAIGRPLVRDLPVGLNLHDHTGAQVELVPVPEYAAELDEDLQEGTFAQSQVVVHAGTSECRDGWDLHLLPFGLALEGGDVAVSVFVMLLDPDSRGRLRVQSADPTALSTLDFDRLGDPAGRDRARLEEGIRLARELLHVEPAASLVQEELGESITGYAHPVGTCALGTVVGPQLGVLGVEGLWVADASVIPRVPRANTNVLAMAVGVRAAELLPA